MTTMADSPASPIRRKGILNRITDRWWQISLLWIVFTVPLLSVISLSVPPRFEAVSLLQVQPVVHELYGSTVSAPVDPEIVKPYLQTQVALITSERVLTTALASPQLNNLSFVRKSDNATSDLRKKLVVETMPDTHLIRVALALPEGKQAAAIVNSVVNSYLAYRGEFKRGENSILRRSLSAQFEKIQNEIKIKRANLQALARKSYLPRGSVIPLNESGKQSDPAEPTFGSVTEELRDWVAGEMVKTDVDLIKAQATLEAKQAAIEGENDQQYRQSLADLKLKVAVLLKQKELLAKYYGRLKIDTKVTNDDEFEAKFLSHELEVLLKSQDHLKTNLEELDFVASQDDYRVALVDNAKVPTAPTGNDRVIYMVAAPILVLSVLIGFFWFLPLNDERLRVDPANRVPQEQFGS